MKKLLLFINKVSHQFRKLFIMNTIYTHIYSESCPLWSSSLFSLFLCIMYLPFMSILSSISWLFLLSLSLFRILTEDTATVHWTLSFFSSPFPCDLYFASLVIYLIYMVLRIEPRDLSMISKCFSTGLHLRPTFSFSFILFTYFLEIKAQVSRFFSLRSQE